MTLEDLREHGVLLPEEEWGAHRLESTTRQAPLLMAFGVAAGSLVATYMGDGGTWTWVGTGAFLVLLLAITWMCDRAVLRQRRRVGRERSEATPPDGGGEEATNPSEADRSG